jgi:hypothetical protein
VDGIVFLCAVLLLFAVPLILRKHRPENNISLQIAAVLVLAFYLFCLVLATPPPRITAFLAMPVAFVAGMVACQILTFPALSPVRLLVAAALASIFFLSGKSAVKTFTFQPDQRWRDAAVAVRSLFPGGVEVDTSGYRNMMAAYLGEKFQVQDRIPDARELQGGNRLLFSSAHYRMHTPVDRAALYPGLELLAVRFPLNDSQEQTLYLHVPAGFLIRNIQIGEGQVGVPAQIPAAARIKILLPAASRSLHLLFHGPVEKLALSADSSFRLTKSGNLVSLSLPENAREVELQFPQETGAILESAWAYPKGF